MKTMAGENGLDYSPQTHVEQSTRIEASFGQGAYMPTPKDEDAIFTTPRSVAIADGASGTGQVRQETRALARETASTLAQVLQQAAQLPNIDDAVLLARNRFYEFLLNKRRANQSKMIAAGTQTEIPTSTIIGATVVGNRLIVIGVGNSAGYLLRAGTLTRLNQPTSEMVGVTNKVSEPIVHQLQSGDKIAIVSDGMLEDRDDLGERVIQRVLSSSRTASEASTAFQNLFEKHKKEAQSGKRPTVWARTREPYRDDVSVVPIYYGTESPKGLRGTLSRFRLR